MKFPLIKIMALLLLLLSLSISQAASQLHDTEQLQQLVYDYIKQGLNKQKVQNYDIHVSTVDSRLRLAHCPKEDISLFIPHNQLLTQSSTLGVQCNKQPSDWKIYIPIKIKILAKVVTTRHSLPKGYRINKTDLRLMNMNIKKLRYGYFNDEKMIIGMITKRNLRPGQIISPKYLMFPQLVKRGDSVTINAINQAIKVSMKGIAIENGKLGDTIRVKNLSSSKVIDAKVVTSGQVEIKI